MQASKVVEIKKSKVTIHQLVDKKPDLKNKDTELQKVDKFIFTKPKLHSKKFSVTLDPDPKPKNRSEIIANIKIKFESIEAFIEYLDHTDTTFYNSDDLRNADNFKIKSERAVHDLTSLTSLLGNLLSITPDVYEAEKITKIIDTLNIAKQNLIHLNNKFHGTIKFNHSNKEHKVMIPIKAEEIDVNFVRKYLRCKVGLLTIIRQKIE